MKHLKHLKHAHQQVDPVRAVDAVGLTVGLLMTVVVFFAGIQPILDHRDDLQAQQEALDTEREQADELSRTVQQLRSHLQATRRAVERNPMHLASLRALNERLSQMTELGMDTGLRIERIQPGGRAAGEHYHTVPIKLAGHGEFGASTRFLHRLHESFPDVAIASLSLAGRPEQARANEAASFDLTLLWYAAPPPGADEDQS